MLYLFGGLFLAFGLGACTWLFVAQNVETPSYRVVEADGAIELRAYPEMIAAEITTTGSRRDAVRAGFRPLAGYIFAKEREGDKIAMTAPVTQRAGEGQDWTVQFIMPSQYTMEDLPAPVRKDVRLTPIAPRQRVAIKFSGVADDELIAKQESLLRAWMEARGLTPDGAPIYAYYNDPFTPGFLRRNEVIFDLASGS
jgi:hypothetical protein